MLQNFWRSLVQTLNIGQLRERSMFTSTRQAEVLNPIILDTQVVVDSPVLGRSCSTGQIKYWSLHEMTRRKEIFGPNAAVIGGYNQGKSSLLKTIYGSRALAVGSRVAVFDRKRQQDASVTAGEYRRLSAMTAGSVARIVCDRRPGVGTVFNPLDPAIIVEGDEHTAVGQDELLLMVAEVACGHKLIDQGERGPAYALRQAHKAALKAAAAESRVAILSDVITALYAPSVDAVPGPRDPDGTPTLTRQGLVTVETVTQWGLMVALNLEKFVDGELSGLLDGETSKDLDVDAQLLIFDTSALSEGSAALGLMMAVISTFISAKWAQMPGAKLLLLEEAYNFDLLDGVPTIFRALAKRGRGSGLSLITAIHHLSDLKPGSEMWTLIREADVAHIFRQDKIDDAKQVIEFYSLPEHLLSTITTLSQGTHLLKRAGHPPELIQHLRTEDEVWMTNTDEPMIGLSEDAPDLTAA